MADATRFGHDQLAHVLADYLLQVPRFQRAYAWDETNVREFLRDLADAQRRQSDYFMGTVVFSSSEDNRSIVVDGQQRLATTAIMILAIRDELIELGKERQALELEKRYLRGYVLGQEEDVERLVLNPKDMPEYVRLLDKQDSSSRSHRIVLAYQVCREYLNGIPMKDRANQLLYIVRQLTERVQVLKAEAMDLPEAYVIFETLNDRGAGLTTADLLKNFLFSVSGRYFETVERYWVEIESSFDKPENLVKFIRYEFVSRGHTVSARRLYRSIQEEVGDKPRGALAYVERLKRANVVYQAVKNPEDDYWIPLRQADVSDTLYAYRRFGFEAGFPVILAAFENWSLDDAARLLIKLGNWSIRAQVTGRLGGSTAESSFNEAAVAISSGSATNQIHVRQKLERILPTDQEFLVAMKGLRNVQSARAKYFLAMLDQAALRKSGVAMSPLDWTSRGITVEHILPRSKAQKPDEQTLVDSLGNLALLEKTLNRRVGSKPFEDRKAVYSESKYHLTAKLSRLRVWNVGSIRRRMNKLASLAPEAWPDS